jgi:hypothetical protein
MRDLPPCAVCGESLNYATTFAAHVVKTPDNPHADLCGAVTHEACHWQHVEDCTVLKTIGRPPTPAEARTPTTPALVSGTPAPAAPLPDKIRRTRRPARGKRT